MGNGRNRGAIESGNATILVVLEQWSAEHCVFVVEAFFEMAISALLFSGRFIDILILGGRVPSRSTILLCVSNFRATNSAVKCNSTSLPRSAQSPQNIDQEAVEHSPR